MGATFGAVHLRGVGIDQVRDRVVDSVEAEGFELLDTEDEADDAEVRRVLLVDVEGWVALVDEDAELDPGLLSEWAEILSEDLEAVAVGISVQHSDEAVLCLYAQGECGGLIRVPKDARRKKDGHAYVDASFLLPLASSEDGRALVGAPVVADTTFPEQVVLRLAGAVGIPHPGLGAEAWTRPPAGAIKLRFRDVEQAASSARVPPAPRRISLALPPDPIEGVEGYPMDPHGFLDVTLEGGDPVSGLEVEVWGPGVALLEWTGLAGWNPFVDGADGNPLVWVARPEPDPADAHRLRFAFPEARLQAADSDFEMLQDPIGARHLRQFSEALRAASRGRFIAGLRADARSPGEASISFRVREAGGGLCSETAELNVRIEHAPRRPVHPPRSSDATELGDARALQDYAGRSWAFLWAAFAAPWSSVERLALDVGDALAAELLSITGARRLKPRVVSAGTHPELSLSLKPGRSLSSSDWLPVRNLLAVEAAVTLVRPGEYGSAGSVILRHEPYGSTILGPEIRTAIREDPPPHIPVQIGACLPRPRRRKDSVHVGEVLDRALRRVVSEPRCIGAMIGATGRPLDPADDDHPYESVCDLHGGHPYTPWLESHVRGPGWRVLAPRRVALRLGEVPEGVSVEVVPAGSLVTVDVPSPFDLEGERLEAIERFVLDAVGSRAEITSLHAHDREDLGG